MVCHGVPCCICLRKFTWHDTHTQMTKQRFNIHPELTDYCMEMSLNLKFDPNESSSWSVATWFAWVVLPQNGSCANINIYRIYSYIPYLPSKNHSNSKVAMQIPKTTKSFGVLKQRSLSEMPPKWFDWQTCQTNGNNHHLQLGCSTGSIHNQTMRAVQLCHLLSTFDLKIGALL